MKIIKMGIALIGVLVVLVCGVCTFLYIQGKVGAEETSIEMSSEEKEQFQKLEKAKLITLEEVKGTFQKEAFKITGFEEIGRETERKVTDTYYEWAVKHDDSFITKKGKEFFNGMNKREITARFKIDYGLGFDMKPLLQNGITVDEYKGIVKIQTPSLLFTQFYIDPAYTLEEENGVLTALLMHDFSDEEKAFLIKKMEEQIKEEIMNDDNIQLIALELTKQKIKNLIQAINPKIDIIFED